MRYCKKCVMPDTRPYMKFNDEGICYPCQAAEYVKKIDWKKRWGELEKLADKYRGMNGNYYDCMITASGGKDSYYQTYIMKEKLGMNPLLVSVDNFTWTQTGHHNWDNLRTEFGVDAHVMSLNPKVCKNLFQKSIRTTRVTNLVFRQGNLCIPFTNGGETQPPLVIYGEDTNFLYGGPNTEETPSAMKQITNDVVKPVPWDVWLDDKVTMKEVNPGIFPTEAEIKKVKLNPNVLKLFCPLEWI